MSNFLNEAFGAVSGTDWDERPVDIEQFVTDEKFLGLPPLSDYQYQMIRAGSQIYKYETLVALYGEERAQKRWGETCTEVILQLGKGSGKDYTSTISCAYIVYLLLCLKDPAKYYGKPKDDTIDIINVAVNAEQAKNVFFKNFVKRINNCPWFNGKYDTPTQNSISFDKSISVYSGHSEREAFEGLNLIYAVLDEISAFALTSESGNQNSKTAQATYDMYRDSVDSRFPDYGKLLLLSFPRFKDDFIQQRYNAVIAEKETIIRKETLKLDADLPDGTMNNEFEVSWEEDHILRYEYPRIWALRRPTWEVNPLRKITDFTRSFHENLGNALGKYACMPSNLEDGYFKNMDAIRDAFVLANPVDEHGIFLDSFKAEAGVKYYIHVDLAQKHDYCAVSMAHVDKWVKVSVGAEYEVIHPVVKVDLIRWWTPTKEKSVDFADVRNFITHLRDRGFDIGLCTFDRWNSHDTMNILQREHGIKTDILSVAVKHYDDFLSVAYGKRLVGPFVPLLIEELGELRMVKNKIDHPRKGSKDLSDATCGAIFNAISYTKKPVDQEAEVMTYSTLARRNREEAVERAKKANQGITGPIKAPPRSMPSEIESYLENVRLL